MSNQVKTPKTTKNKKENEMAKAPKTIKVRTLIVSIAIILGFIASFIGGVVFANNFNDTVEAKALEKVGEIELKLNQQ